ncbi:MAG: pseudouridine synthase [Candidatus Altiarchaeota archaeon]|nr:pseudouridine synthase [Candidatus Altiarchaeota archaeon]
MKVYLHQFLSGTGSFDGKAAVYRAIREGEIAVDGKVVLNRLYQLRPGKREVRWNGAVLKPASSKTYIILNKPMGFLSSRLTPVERSFGRRSVFDLLAGLDEKVVKSLFCVGRLDEDTSGLLILTNDGELCSRLTDPKFGVERTYSGFLEKDMAEEDIKRIEEGVVIELEENGKVTNYRTKKCGIMIDERDRRKFVITLSEGKKREVRRMFRATGNKVKRLRRIAIGGLRLDSLGIREGKYLVSDRSFIEDRIREAGACRLGVGRYKTKAFI